MVAALSKIITLFYFKLNTAHSKYIGLLSSDGRIKVTTGLMRSVLLSLLRNLHFFSKDCEREKVGLG